MDIKNKTVQELEYLSSQIRNKIINVVSKNGGHLSSSLGAVELIIAIHKVFDIENDPIIFDVSHQCYAHKLLTKRWDKFKTIRQYKGLSGFSKPRESKYDYFVSGHSSTSISLAVGAAKAFRLNSTDNTPVVMIGDGSMSAGLVYEALNELGDLKLPVVIILNDNEMSIAKPIGAISKYLSRLLAGQTYQGFKKKVEKVLKKYSPNSGVYIAKRLEESLKLITPGLIFEEMGCDYIGPIDGHNIQEIIETLKIAKAMKKPVIVHAKTVKGKGYSIAEGHHELWHGVGPFDASTGEFLNKRKQKDTTEVFADCLLELSKNNDKIVGVTAAMPNGTGVDKLIKNFPDRFWDVAIAEQHAITSMASMAKIGFKPFVVIYSTFLQRGFDQIVHDVCLMNLPVVFAIDRAGIVGADGETHQGQFDISYLRILPNMTIFAPRDDDTMKLALKFAEAMKTPCAIRYPRGCFKRLEYKANGFQIGKAELLKESESKKIFVGYGSGVSKAIDVANIIKEDVAILDLKFVKPLDEKLLLQLQKKHKDWYVFSDSQAMGGVGSAILEMFSKQNKIINLKTFEYDDIYIQHGDKTSIEDEMGISTDKIANLFDK
ncbi:MAG: 1-deoxy-D-xylulose-5-phosphate synthase [Epsilonproteobacteria bacterium]|nr:MAG: 1-deoxy-D-xylulose-5-phosphate synthase [Campylobacterota bacterium]